MRAFGPLYGLLQCLYRPCGRRGCCVSHERGYIDAFSNITGASAKSNIRM